MRLLFIDKNDAALAGTAGQTVRATNAFGTELLFEQFEEFRPGRNGYDLVTTLDSTIQYYVEKGLKQAVADSTSKTAREPSPWT